MSRNFIATLLQQKININDREALLKIAFSGDGTTYEVLLKKK